MELDMTDRQFEPRVDQRTCIGCGLCPDMLGAVFHMRDPRGTAFVRDEDGWKPDRADRLRETAANCPVGAIEIEPREADAAEGGD